MVSLSAAQVRRESAAQHSPSATKKRRVYSTLMHTVVAVGPSAGGNRVSVIRDYLGRASVATTIRYITTNLQ